MFKLYTNVNQQHYNNHCTETAVEFIPDICEAQCYHGGASDEATGYECRDEQHGDYDSLDEWVESRIDVAIQTPFDCEDGIRRFALELSLAYEAFDSRAEVIAI